MNCLNRINNVLAPDHKIKHIRADGDTTFAKHVYQEEKPLISNLDEPPYVKLGQRIHTGNVLTWFLRNNNIELYIFMSPYTNKSRIVDRAIRTIRDMLVTDEAFLNNVLVAEAVIRYNNTKHSAFNHKFSPAEVQASHDLENVFIRENLYNLDEINKLQRDEGFFNYKPGNILLIHLDESKTDQKMAKKRRTFGMLAIFLSYEYGNVRCQVIKYLGNSPANSLISEPITIPIYFTKFVADNFESIPARFKNIF
jgi:hypothetical protein